MADNTTQVSEQINSAVNNALGVGALAAIYTGNFVSLGNIQTEGGEEELILVPLVITENGNYIPADYNADGFSEVTANISASNALMDFLTSGDFPSYYYQNGNPYVNAARDLLDDPSENISSFITNYATKKASISQNEITASVLQYSVDEFLDAVPRIASREYEGFIYGSIAEAYNMDLLFNSINNEHSWGDATITIEGNFFDYSLILLQGVYYTQAQASYNTTMLYIPETNKSMWTGMIDRNGSYSTVTTITGENTASINYSTKDANVIIYGMN